MKTRQVFSMKRQGIVLVLLFFFASSTIGQQINNPTPRLITVTGSAEMSVEPDEVELSITVYANRNDFDKKEQELSDICVKHGIPKDQLNFKNSLGVNDWYHWYWWWHYRNASALSQTYKLKITSKLDFLSFVKDLNKNWIQNITISSTTNKDLSTYRKEVKKEAMRMAKEKAAYMLEAVGESLGSIVSVEEINADKNDKQFNGRPYYSPYYYWDNPYYLGNGGMNGGSSMSSNSVMSAPSSGGGSSSDPSGIGGLSSIKLRYEVKAVFEIR